MRCASHYYVYLLGASGAGGDLVCQWYPGTFLRVTTTCAMVTRTALVPLPICIGQTSGGYLVQLYQDQWPQCGVGDHGNKVPVSCNSPGPWPPRGQWSWASTSVVFTRIYVKSGQQEKCGGFQCEAEKLCKYLFCLYWCYYCWQETAGDDMDLSASDTQYDVMTYNDLSSSSNMESRVAPNRRRRK